MLKFNNLDLYFKEYYNKSDIDMCNLDNIFDFIDKVYEIKNLFNTNIKTYFKLANINTMLKCLKNSTLIINEIWIKNLIEINKKLRTTYLVEDILNGLNSFKIKSYLYDVYVKMKLNDNLKYTDTKYWNELKYNDYFNFCCYENFKVIYKNKNYELGNGELIKYYENHKYRIINCKLNHEIEIFKIKYKTFHIS